jgi:transposase
MPNGMRWVGLDVHAHASAVAVFGDVTGEVITRRVVGRPIEVLDVVHGLPRPVRAVYEAGRRVMGWCGGRALRASRWRSARRAPSSAGRAIQSRPTGATRSPWRGCSRPAICGWCGCPAKSRSSRAIWCAAARTRGRISCAPGTGWRRSWCGASAPSRGRGSAPLRHRHWLSQQRFDDPASRITYADYLHAHDVVLARREHVGRELERLVPSRVWAETIARLCCLRGINTLTALGLCAEIGDWRRFDHPDSIASHVGLGPSEHSSGQSRRLGKITKAGSTHARRLLVEAALHHRLTPAVGGKLAVRQRGQDPALIDHAWRVQRRLNARWNRLRTGRGRPAAVVTIAIARELVGACREIATTR